MMSAAIGILVPGSISWHLSFGGLCPFMPLFCLRGYFDSIIIFLLNLLPDILGILGLLDNCVEKPFLVMHIPGVYEGYYHVRKDPLEKHDVLSP